MKGSVILLGELDTKHGKNMAPVEVGNEKEPELERGWTRALARTTDSGSRQRLLCQGKSFRKQQLKLLWRDGYKPRLTEAGTLVGRKNCPAWGRQGKLGGENYLLRIHTCQVCYINHNIYFHLFFKPWEDCLVLIIRKI